MNILNYNPDKKTMDKPTKEQFENAVEVLKWFEENINDLEGWGFNPDYIKTVKFWLEGFSRGDYSK